MLAFSKKAVCPDFRLGSIFCCIPGWSFAFTLTSSPGLSYPNVRVPFSGGGERICCWALIRALPVWRHMTVTRSWPGGISPLSCRRKRKIIDLPPSRRNHCSLTFLHFLPVHSYIFPNTIEIILLISAWPQPLKSSSPKVQAVFSLLCQREVGREEDGAGV